MLFCTGPRLACKGIRGRGSSSCWSSGKTRRLPQYLRIGTRIGSQNPQKLVSYGGRYRILTYDFHRVRGARCFVIRELQGALGSAQECSGAYFSQTYEHGPESWTHKWTHVKPGWHPVFFRLTSHFGGGSLANYCGLVSSGRWQLDPLQLPQVSTMKE